MYDLWFFSLQARCSYCYSCQGKDSKKCLKSCPLGLIFVFLFVHLNCNICVRIVNIPCDCFIWIGRASDTSFAFSIVYCSALSCYSLSLAFPSLLCSPLLSSPLLSSPLLSSPGSPLSILLSFNYLFFYSHLVHYPFFSFPIFLVIMFSIYVVVTLAFFFLSYIRLFISFCFLSFSLDFPLLFFSSCQVGVIPEKHTWVFYTLEEVANGIQVRGAFVYSP